MIATAIGKFRSLRGEATCLRLYSQEVVARPEPKLRLPGAAGPWNRTE